MEPRAEYGDHVGHAVTLPDITERIVAYEQGNLTEDAALRLFADLVKCGLAWTLQGHYGRTAQALIAAGFLSQKGEVLREPDYWEA